MGKLAEAVIWTGTVIAERCPLQVGGHSLRQRFSISWHLIAVGSPPLFVRDLTDEQAKAILLIAISRVNSRESRMIVVWRGTCSFAGQRIWTKLQSRLLAVFTHGWKH
jgi:hypothetical protein